ncbi:MAG: transposase [Sutterellaceae bacterium]|nr:transposase [Sutterellaceae bacterium]MDD7442397.1 transposase [Sutterellaceae bacterium]MDY2867166.1 transposase [Mesosutterella sp.]
MARLARLSVPGCPHHVVQAGCGASVFRSDDDCLFYIDCLRKGAREFGVLVAAYLLLPGEVHLVALPGDRDSLSRFMQSVSRRYVRWFNRRHGLEGTLWEGRFRSSPVAPEWLAQIALYIERLPVERRFVSSPEQYVWSSFAHHAGLRTDPFLPSPAELSAACCGAAGFTAVYGELLGEETPEGFGRMVEQMTRRGRPIGPRDFIDRIPAPEERKRALRPRGRPRKSATLGSGHDTSDL